MCAFGFIQCSKYLQNEKNIHNWKRDTENGKRERKRPEMRRRLSLMHLKMERLIEGITKKGRNATEKTKRGRKGQQGASSYKLQPSP